MHILRKNIAKKKIKKRKETVVRRFIVFSLFSLPLLSEKHLHGKEKRAVLYNQLSKQSLITAEAN